jgi:MYXO-CTERM domain-containing protein
LGAFLGVLLAAFLLPATAAAYCRTLTGTAGGAPAAEGCLGRGSPIYWKNRCVGYSVDRLASRRISYEQTATIVNDAFARWSQSACPVEGASSRVSIDVRDLGEVACGKVGYSADAENQNVIIFQEDRWPHAVDPSLAGDSSTLGLTTVTFNKKTGEIYDADMEINSHTFKVSATDTVAEGGYDLPSIVTHEAGHFLGLAHSTDRNATMFASYNNGEMKKRYLKLDDVLGICSAYRPDGSRVTGEGTEQAGAACNPLPRRGLDRACGTATTSCAATPGAAGGGPLPWLAPLAAAALWARRRRRRPSFVL